MAINRKPNKRPRKKSFTGGSVEDREQGQLMAWVKNRYPEILCETDIAGAKLTPVQARKIYAQRQPRKGWPDVRIFEPRGEYSAFFIEYKKTGANILKRDGELRADEHLRQQAKLHKALLERGYLAGFVVGLENAKRAVKAYLNSDFDNLKTVLINDN